MIENLLYPKAQTAQPVYINPRVMFRESKHANSIMDGELTIL